MQYSNPIKIPRTNLIARARLVPPMLTQVMFLVLRSLKKNKLTKLRDTTHFDSEDDYRRGCRNVSHCQQQQSYSGLRSPGRSNSTYF